MTDIPFIRLGRYLIEMNNQPGDCGDWCPCQELWGEVGWRWSPTGELPPWPWLGPQQWKAAA